MKIIFSGGGTIGSVSPLLAVFEVIKKQKPETQCLWVATRKGSEEKLIKGYNLPIKKIFSGKLRRYFSFRNFIDPLFLFFGFIQSFFIILKFKPNVIVSAGGFVSVPLVWAGKLLGKPSIIHQQDVIPGLANLLMARLADKITVTFEKSLNDFFPDKTIWIGNPVRFELLEGDKQKAIDIFNLEPNLPTVLIIGGGTGSLILNQITVQALESLTKFCQVIHITGGRIEIIPNLPRYHNFEFITESLKDAYAISDLVISRAGMSVLTELAVIGKAALVIPIANSHQEANASEFLRQNAIIFAEEENLNPEGFSHSVKELLDDVSQRQFLIQNIRQVMPANAAEKMSDLIYSYGK